MAYIGRQLGQGVRNRFIYTATAGQTTFSGSDDNGGTLVYTDGTYVDVNLNGVELVSGTDYTATSGTSIVLTTGASLNDTLSITVYDVFAVADTVSAQNGGTFSGDVNVNGDVDVTGTVTADGADLDGAVVINESGADADFRVESDSQSHMLFVDASQNRIGINGITEPNATVDINNGNLRFSTTNPSPLLSGIASSAGALQIDTNSSVATTKDIVQVKNNGSLKFLIEGNGDVQNNTGSYGAISDRRLKENIIDASSQWDDIQAIRLRKYSFISEGLSGPNMLGVIAQELEEAGLSGLVKTKTDPDTGEETKVVKHSIIYMKAVKALQEAIERIETLEAKVAELESN